MSEWYAGGLRFECTRCGMCCTGPPGLVAFTPEEGREMARALGVGYRNFLVDHACRWAGGWALEEVEGEHGFDCTLLDREKVPGEALCRVREARPGQCRTWPFWPENLSNPGAWKKAARRCAGMGRGPLVAIEEIRRQRAATPNW